MANYYKQQSIAWAVGDATTAAACIQEFNHIGIHLPSLTDKFDSTAVTYNVLLGESSTGTFHELITLKSDTGGAMAYEIRTLGNVNVGLPEAVSAYPYLRIQADTTALAAVDATVFMSKLL